MEPHERAEPQDGSRRAERAELADLRRRAYGPGSGPDPADPADLERLRVLEARAAGATGSTGATVATPHRAAAARTDHDAGAGTAERPGAAGDAEARRADADAHRDAAPAAPGPRPSRRLAVLWAASVAAAVALTGVVVGVATAPAGREVAVVRFDPDQELPVYMRDYYGGAETGSARFHGLTLVRLEGDPSAYPRVHGECLSVQPSRASLDSTEGGGCAAGAFGASAQFVVAVGAPQELRDEYPVGTALLFDLRGDAVHVRVDDSPRIPSPTRTRG